MYISKIKINNIRCFEDFELDLKKNGSISLWTMISGDNGVGKTSLLRCISLGLNDEASAAALMKEFKGQFLRRKDTLNAKGQTGVIEITLEKKEHNEPYKIITEIKKQSPSSPEKISQQTIPKEDFPWGDIFVCGYGPHRASFAERSQEEYTSLEAVYTLFNIETSLQNPELVLNRQEPDFRDWLSKKLLTILMLDSENKRIEFTKKGMEIPGPWGTLPFEVLSDGYRSTINWVTDFFGWSIYADKIYMGKDKYEGILLIDELEQHLHPKWQRHIVERLRKQFPEIQFITTTHSPLVASGISDIDNAIIVSQRLDDNYKITKEIITTDQLKGMRADQVLTSEVFGLITTKSLGNATDVTRYYELYRKKRNKKEHQEFQNLKSQMTKGLSLGDNDYERIVEKATREAIDKILKEHSKTFIPDVLDLEMKRKLKEIFNSENKKND